MSRCTECKGGTPAPLWKRCEPCAMRMLRHLMSGGMATQGESARRYARGDKVMVNGEVNRPGTVVRVRDNQYVVKLEGGGRCYVGLADLRELAPSKEP